MKKLYVLDLDKGTYVSSATDDYSLYTGEFSNGPDQIVRNGDGDFLYFTEDGKHFLLFFCYLEDINLTHCFPYRRQDTWCICH